MQNKLQISHVLYQVKDLHIAVGKLREAGFIVEYGRDPVKAYNAMIWFEKGIFIEIYHDLKLPFYKKWMMGVLGYQSVLNRMIKWKNVGEGWSEWSLESQAEHLNAEKEIFNQKNISFKFHKAKRKDIHGRILKWELLMPDDIDFPFLMSAYIPNPRPKKINHPNGITGIQNIVVGRENLNTKLVDELLIGQSELKLVEGKGLKTIEMSGPELKIEDILQTQIL